MNTRPDLDAIEARTNAATKAPWTHANLTHSKHAGNEVWHVGQRSFQEEFVATVVVGGDEQSHRDAEFIAHSRVDVETLCAYIRHLEHTQASGGG